MFHFGVAYYPEHWPEERWAIDARLMQEAGFNTVRLAEFSWSRLEPEEGRFEFDWLDRAIAILSAHQIQVVMGTPSASAPPWLLQSHPELFRMRSDGRRVTYGNRRGYCPNHPLYRQYVRRIVTRMAAHYRDHPAVIGWQIDNEMGERCFCPCCQGAFHTWLQARYPTLADLNRSWGTVFWSQDYTAWEQVPIPLETGSSPNPGLALDYYRFMSDSYVDFQRCQVEILRAGCPRHWITHDCMGFDFDQLNPFDLARDLDHASLNHYPRSQWSMQPGVDPAEFALSLDATRGLKHRSFWMTEQQAGPGGWELISVQPRPGELRLWAYQALAHGADGMLFFRWRSCPFGTEQFWHGFLDHDGVPSRRYFEIKRMGQEIARAGEQLLGSQVRPQVALVLSYDSRFAFQIQPNNPAFSYGAHFKSLYRSFYQRHVAVEIVSPDDDLSAYRLVVAPSLHLLAPAAAARLAEYVHRGGVLAVTQRSGVKDAANRVVERRLPGYLGEVMGVEVQEYDSLAPGMENELELALPGWPAPRRFPCGVLCDLLKPLTARPLAAYLHDYYAGMPAITQNGYGAGQAIYIGALGPAELYNTLAEWLLDLAGVASPGAILPADLELQERWQGEQRFWFVLNFSGQTRPFSPRLPCQLLVGSPPDSAGSYQLAPGEVLVLAVPGG